MTTLLKIICRPVLCKYTLKKSQLKVQFTQIKMNEFMLIVSQFLTKFWNTKLCVIVMFFINNLIKCSHLNGQDYLYLQLLTFKKNVRTFYTTAESKLEHQHIVDRELSSSKWMHHNDWDLHWDEEGEKTEERSVQHVTWIHVCFSL